MGDTYRVTVDNRQGRYGWCLNPVYPLKVYRGRG